MRGEVADARSDVFSFCVSLYEALYGQRPFAGSSMKKLQAAIEEGAVRPPPIITRVPGWIRDVLLRGLQARPDRRFVSMSALLDSLRVAQAVHRRRGRWAGVVAAAILCGLLSVLWRSRNVSATPPALPEARRETFEHAVAESPSAPASSATASLVTAPTGSAARAAPPTSARTRPSTKSATVGSAQAEQPDRIGPAAAPVKAPLVGNNGALILE
jgi:hypothetical protein